MYSREVLGSGNKSIDEVDGTYEVERAHMTWCAVTENTLTILLEQLIINENLSALNAQRIRPLRSRVLRCADGCRVRGFPRGSEGGHRDSQKRQFDCRIRRRRDRDRVLLKRRELGPGCGH